MSKTLKDYEEMALRFIWGSGERGAISKEVWLHVNKELGGIGTPAAILIGGETTVDVKGSISRASIINFLQDMASDGVIQVNYRTGKGGHHGVYSSPMGEDGFKRYVAKNVIAKLFEKWPDATKEVVEEIFR